MQVTDSVTHYADSSFFANVPIWNNLMRLKILGVQQMIWQHELMGLTEPIGRIDSPLNWSVPNDGCNLWLNQLKDTVQCLY